MSGDGGGANSRRYSSRLEFGARTRRVPVVPARCRRVIYFTPTVPVNSNSPVLQYGVPFKRQWKRAACMERLEETRPTIRVYDEISNEPPRLSCAQHVLFVSAICTKRVTPHRSAEYSFRPDIFAQHFERQVFSSRPLNGGKKVQNYRLGFSKQTCVCIRK